MDTRNRKGRPHPAPRIGARREYPKIQMVHQGTTTPGVELARRKEQRRMDCTILVHIDTGTSALNTQNKRHLHWKVLDPAQEMNNDIEFATPAHNLLRKTDTRNSVHQAHRNKSASLLASPQAARKKRFTKLDLALMIARLLGSIGPSPARNKLTYD